MAASTGVNDQQLALESDDHAQLLKASRETLVSLEAQGFNGVETAPVTPDRNQRVAHGGAIPAVQPPLPVTEDEVIATLDLALDGNWLLGAKYATGNRNSTRGLELRLLVQHRSAAISDSCTRTKFKFRNKYKYVYTRTVAYHAAFMQQPCQQRASTHARTQLYATCRETW